MLVLEVAVMCDGFMASSLAYVCIKNPYGEGDATEDFFDRDQGTEVVD